THVEFELAFTAVTETDRYTVMSAGPLPFSLLPRVKGANAAGSVEHRCPAGLPRQLLAACPPRLGRAHRRLRLGHAPCCMYSDSLIHQPGRCDPVQGNQGDLRREEPALRGRHGFGSGTVVGVAEFAEVDVGATLRCPVQAAGHVVEPLPDAHE